MEWNFFCPILAVIALRCICICICWKPNLAWRRCLHCIYVCVHTRGDFQFQLGKKKHEFNSFRSNSTWGGEWDWSGRGGGITKEKEKEKEAYYYTYLTDRGRRNYKGDGGLVSRPAGPPSPEPSPEPCVGLDRIQIHGDGMHEHDANLPWQTQRLVADAVQASRCQTPPATAHGGLCRGVSGLQSSGRHNGTKAARREAEWESAFYKPKRDRRPNSRVAGPEMASLTVVFVYVSGLYGEKTYD